MVIVPSIDVRAGRVAADPNIEPLDLARRYVAEGAEELHLVDLDGAERGKYTNADLLARIAREARVACRLAGGISSIAKADEARAAGFAGVLFSSAVFGDEGLLRRVAAIDGAIVEIEAKDGQLAPRGGETALVERARYLSVQDAARLASGAGVSEVYVIDLASEGRSSGPPLELLEQLRESFSKATRLHTGGGVATLEDVRAVARAGAASLVIGRALIERRFTIAEAKAACA